MDGLQLASAIRARAGGNLPLMLLTSQIATVDESQLQRLGIRHCLNKPVRREEFLLGVCNMLGIDGRPPQPATPQRDDLAQLRLSGTVLVVEDNEINQKVATAMLAALGLKTAVAPNGQVAVERLRGETFDLVLMDCQMPVMDGYAATAAIRALPEDRRGIPILALTANALQGDEARCLAAGMNGFLTKPLTFQHLATTLMQWLPTASHERAAVPAAQAPLESGAINLRQIATLRDIGERAGTDLVGEVLQSFLEEAGPQLSRLEAAVQSRDAMALARCAHAMKSSCANLGAEQLSALYRRLENLGRNNQVDEAHALLQELRRAHEIVIRQAQEILREAA
jgi:CheY-like chemotaxis protein/HPt (histidine-containing phosphotransfer) domain-containing protein